VARHYIFLVGSLWAFILAHIATNALFIADRADYTQFESEDSAFRQTMKVGMTLWALGLAVESCLFLLTPALAETDPTITYSTFDAATTVAIASASSLSMLSAFAVCTMASHSRVKWVMKGVSVALTFLMFAVAVKVMTLYRDLQLPSGTGPLVIACIVVSVVSIALFIVCTIKAKRQMISEWNMAESMR
jgi:hypothetical protein